MNSNANGRILLVIAFALGLLSVAWVGAGFVGTNRLALAMTVLIGAVYVLGALEIRRFRAHTASLAAALADVPQPLTELADWLGRVHPALQGAVRQRIEGERVVLPGLALTPYLVGLLVMLGMLGTFLGVVVTFKGAVFALEGSADLQAIRAALAEPIKGLALSFGTSVAGVATSAMLGLMSALSRRERMDVARALDAQIATVFHPFSRGHQRQETFRALQSQASALPEVVQQLKALMEQVERRNQQLNEQLLNRQEQFHREVSVAYTGLARSVEQSLSESLAASARVAGESLVPVVESAMTVIVRESQRTHEQVVSGVGRAMEAFAGSFEQRAAALVAGVQQAVSQTQSEHALAGHEQRAAWTQSLESMAATLQGEWQRAGTQTLAQQQALCQALQISAADIGEHASRQASAIHDDIARLLTQSEAVLRSHTDYTARMVEQQHERMEQLTGRDTLALQERATLMQSISALLQSVHQATGEQHAAIESLVSSASAVLDRVGSQFSETLGQQTRRTEDVAAQVSGSAIELASLGSAFHHGVLLFNTTNEKLIENLQRMEGAIARSMARSDEQLAYYVAQAREVIDLSISSQQGIVEDLRRMHARPVVLLEEPA